MKNISRAIVTGGAGFIGSQLVERLVAHNIETYVIDDLSTGSIDNISHLMESISRDNNRKKDIHFVRGDIRNINSLMHDVKEIDVIFHEAAIANVKKSIEDPIAINDANVVCTLKVLDFALKKDIPKFIFASSAAVYGEIVDDKLPASEEMQCLPLSPYGASKLACEGYLHAYGKTYDIETIALRYANVYGPRQSLNDYSGVITIFIKDILNGRKPVIFGDGLQVRDFVHVSDIAAANLIAAKAEGISREVFNVGSGAAISINKLLNILSKIFLSQPSFTKADYLPPRPGDIRNGIISIEKIKSRLNYTPSMPIEMGLTDLVQSYTLIEEKREQISSNKERKAR